MPTMKPPRLTKSRSNSRLAETDDLIMPFKTSIDDIRYGYGRDTLRQHFTGAFPEAQVRPPLETKHSYESNRKTELSRSASYLTVGSHSIELSTPSSESLNSIAGKRLSTVRETNGGIDIAQAIRLLEELKKTATAAELVALHKALLPARESALPSPRLPSPTNEDSLVTPPSGFTRLSSMLPPGVATRDASENLWRTPEEAAAQSEQRRRSVRQSKKGQRPPPLLEEKFNQPRSATPSDYDTLYLGAFGPGTLRVTNGSASPDLSIMRRSLDAARSSIEDFATAPTSPNYSAISLPGQLASQHRPSMGDIMSSDAHHTESAVEDEDMHHDSQQTHSEDALKKRRKSEPAKSGIPVPEERDPSAPRLYRPLRGEIRPRSTEAPREASNLTTTRPRAVSQSQLPVPVESSPATQHRTGDEAAVKENLPVFDNTRSLPVFKEATSSNIPPELPRFAQRWSHRMSLILQEGPNDAQLPANPSENNAAVANLSRQLSVITDKSADPKDTVREAPLQTPDVALAKLNGEENDHAVRDFDEAKVSAESLHQLSRPSSDPKADSGYGSDVSNRPIERKQPKDAGMVYKQFSPSADSSPRTHKAYAGLRMESDEVSLYSFNQVLKSPSLLSGLATPSPPQSRGSKKHLSLLGLHRNKKPDMQPIIDTNVVEDLFNGSPPPSRKPKSPKKLQKAMPAGVRAEIKTQKSKKIADRHSNEPSVIPDIPSHTAKSFERRSRAGSMVDGRSSEATPVEPTAASATLPAELSVDPPSAAASPRPSGTLSREITAVLPDPRSHVVPAIAAVVGSLHEEQNTDIERNDSTTPRALGAASALPSGKPSLETERSGSITPRANAYRGYASQPGRLDCEVADSRSSAESLPPKQVFGMKASEAAELARRRSRDITMGSKEDLFDYPRTAVPKLHQPQPADSARGDQVASDMGPRPMLSTSTTRSNSSATDSIPPLPQLPAHVAQRLSRTDGMASCHSREVSIGLPEDGYSTESIADAVKKAMSARRTKASQRDPAFEEVTASKPMPKKISMKSQQSDDQKLAEAVPSNEVVATNDTGPSTVYQCDEGRTSWEHYAKSWRERRLVASGAHVKMEDGTEDQDQPKRSSTTISRKPVPSTASAIADSSTSHQRSGSSEIHAEVYRDLISNESEPTRAGAGDGVEWRDSAGTFATVQNSSDDDLNPATAPTGATYTDITYRPKSYLSAPSNPKRDRSPGGRVVTADGNYHPYTPAESEKIARSRAKSLAKLTGALATATQSETPPTLPKAAKQVAFHHDTPPEVSQASKQSPKKSPLRSIGRYSGGFEFAGDSAGMRLYRGKDHRASQHIGGLDFSDIPFLNPLAGTTS